LKIHGKTHGILSRQVVDAVGKSGQSMPLLRDKPGGFRYMSITIREGWFCQSLRKFGIIWGEMMEQYKRVVGYFLGEFFLEPIEIKDFEI